MEPPTRPSSGSPRNVGRGFVSWELGTDLVLEVAGLITGELSPFYDESDLARDAAACACVGNATFTEVAEAIFKFLSPRFGEDPGVDENSSTSELKSVLKSWGRKTSGKKSELWQRIRDECATSGERLEDEEAQQARCPIAAGPKRRIQEQQKARVSKTKAKELYGVSKYRLQSLATQYSYSSSFGSGVTYAAKDVKALARQSYKSYDQLRKMQQGSKEWMDNYKATRSTRQARVVAVLLGRGVAEAEAQRATDHVWHLAYFTDNRDSATEEWLRSGAQAAADEAHTWIFHCMRTNFRLHNVRLHANYKYAKSAKYKQDWVADKALQDVQTHPALPRHMRDEAERAWHAAQRAKQDAVLRGEAPAAQVQLLVQR
ncbi:hypothetical protein GPECTOR_12g554 [Gonium pectorale]|uniref:SAP domain-containing protein n=1 Tax=Gonium pectorale TaxID=33097 RepID=A0A150GQG3_GONPE|nr:hypothetical protein GPECTOR_12g554 [Gonium pectorale]|eukprot:KXZ51590.1 hypothetical protein GPECTOR_12g554 [Gonium pectorale]